MSNQNGRLIRFPFYNYILTLFFKMFLFVKFVYEVKSRKHIFANEMYFFRYFVLLCTKDLIYRICRAFSLVRGVDERRGGKSARARCMMGLWTRGRSGRAKERVEFTKWRPSSGPWPYSTWKFDNFARCRDSIHQWSFNIANTCIRGSLIIKLTWTCAWCV